MRPAFRRDETVTDVDCDDQRRANAFDRLLEEARRESRRADHHAVGARRQGSIDELERPVAAADLERQAACVGDPCDEIEAGHARERAVEVDEMESLGAVGSEPSGELDGVSSLQRLGVAASPREPNCAPAQDIDGGEDSEASC
jgi:hypothetical protein